MGKATKYSGEIRERAVRLVMEQADEHPSPWAAITSIAQKFGCSAEMFRHWVRGVERHTGKTPGPSAAEGADQGARAVASRAPSAERDPQIGRCVFRIGVARPPTQVMVSFIHLHSAAYGVGLIFRVLPIARSTSYAYRPG